MEERANTPPSYAVSRFELGALLTRFPYPGIEAFEKAREVQGFTTPKSSDLGTPRFFAMQLDEVLLPNEPLISMSLSKNIVKTVVAGGDGTVKEMIGADDFAVTIQGWAVREGDRRAITNSLVPQDYPEEWLRKLIMLARRNRALAVKCQLMTYYNIQNLLIENIDFPAVEGASDCFAYQIKAVSDESSLGKLIRKK